MILCVWLCHKAGEVLYREHFVDMNWALAEISARSIENVLAMKVHLIYMKSGDRKNKSLFTAIDVDFGK